jgi:hypothetical protein
MCLGCHRLADVTSADDQKPGRRGQWLNKYFERLSRRIGPAGKQPCFLAVQNLA